MKLIFSSLKNGEIFEPEFQNLTPDLGTIEFKHRSAPGGIAVIYAPNGTGKSSFSKLLETENATDDRFFEARDDAGLVIGPENKAFHVIHDQVDRNVIPGTEKDYLVGNQIRREYELRDRINSAFDKAFDSLVGNYKREYKLTKVGDYLLTQMETLDNQQHAAAFPFLRSIINAKLHGKDIDRDKFISYIRNKDNAPVLAELDVEKRMWIIDNCAGRTNLVQSIIDINPTLIIADKDTVLIERHDDAINILKKYGFLDTCVVCDNPEFHSSELLERKQSDRKNIYEKLDEKTRKILDTVVMDEGLVSSDPFGIKRAVTDLISSGHASGFLQLQNDLKLYVSAIEDEVTDMMIRCFDGTSLFQDYDEFSDLVSRNPELDSEELLFIEEIINENIGKDITIERGDDGNYKLRLGGKDLLNAERETMELSSGEQNFISLAFELLFARHSNKEYIILDDPISSFDSVYKNKIAFCIIKFLEGKKQIVLTHNTDLIRLLEVQLNNSFNLYILNNVENGRNGFIPINPQEKALLINLHELIKLFQNKCNTERGDSLLVPSIKDRKQFLMSMIPFMRGYVHISLDLDDDYGSLSDIMHGYSSGSVNVSAIYKKLFGYDFDSEEIVSVDDVLNIDCQAIEVLDEEKFPLLADALKQTLIYYHLRMKVEKELVELFSIPTREMDTLNKIIQKAFPRNRDTDEQNRNLRVFFTSRKTLLNEFNHFEGNMNIFQPAIDITQAALQKEIADIENKLLETRIYATSLAQI